MTRDTSIARAVRHALWMSAMAAAAASIPTLALAQETPASDSETRTVVVTGSRVSNLSAPPPPPPPAPERDGGGIVAPGQLETSVSLNLLYRMEH